MGKVLSLGFNRKNNRGIWFASTFAILERKLTSN